MLDRLSPLRGNYFRFCLNVKDRSIALFHFLCVFSFWPPSLCFISSHALALLPPSLPRRRTWSGLRRTYPPVQLISEYGKGSVLLHYMHTCVFHCAGVLYSAHVVLSVLVCTACTLSHCLLWYGDRLSKEPYERLDG